MKKYEVFVERTSVSYKGIEVEANNAEEAKKKALVKAEDYVFSEKDAHYEVEHMLEQLNNFKS